jgi:glycosyltransferase involved in cell wall biosynthesis
LPVPPPGYGGIERVLDGLCRALAKAGHDVLLYATGDSTCPVELDWRYDEAPDVRQASRAVELCHVLDAYRRVDEWDADVVHDNTLIGPFVGARQEKAPVVTTNHGPFDRDLSKMYRSLAGRVPIVAISHDQASRAAGIPVAAVIHHGIDVSNVPFGRRASGPALFLGRMSPTKGVHTAIRVAREAGVPMHIAAKMREHEEYEYFKAEVEPLLGAGIEYVGEVSEDVKLALLADAACLFNPIDWPEPFGMVMIEALACGTPVVASPRGAATEIVDEGVTGFLGPDGHALARALTEVDRLDRRNCRSAAETRFSSTRMASEHADFFARIVAESRTHTPSRASWCSAAAM